jgi:hypothetical protein
MAKTFCTAVSCMDGRVHLPVIRYLQTRFGVEYVDLITEPGPNRILATRSDDALVESVLSRLGISVSRHESVGVAVVGHHDCAGNPEPKVRQLAHIDDSVAFLRECYPEMEVIGLWVDETWTVSEV